VLAIETRWRDGCVVTLHKRSPEPAAVRLPGDLADRARDGGLRQLLGDSASPDGGASAGVRADGDITLAGYGYRWLRLPEAGALG
jgi:hypothetical protein